MLQKVKVHLDANFTCSSGSMRKLSKIEIDHHTSCLPSERFFFEDLVSTVEYLPFVRNKN